MADYTANIVNTINVAGGGTPILWGDPLWNAFVWGGTGESVNLVDKFLSVPIVASNVISKAPDKSVVNSQAVTNVVYKLPDKFVANSQVATNTVHKDIGKVVFEVEPFLSDVHKSTRKSVYQNISASNVFSPESGATDTHFISAPSDLQGKYLNDPVWNYDFAYPSINAEARFVSGWTRV